MQASVLKTVGCLQVISVLHRQGSLA